MKKTILSALFVAALLSAPSLKAQIIKDAAGNYTTTVKPASKETDKPTGQTFTDLKTGEVYPVYRGSRNGLYIWKTSATGKKRKQYMPSDKPKKQE